MGQYISPDPIGLLGGLHPMAYVHNPMGWVDPFGLNAKPETAKDWEKRFSRIPQSEKTLAAQGKLTKVANKNGWEKNAKLTKRNNRTIYTNSQGKHFAFDTQHGRFEYLDSKGSHLGEYDIDGKQTKIPDTSGGHNIKCK